MTRQTDPRTAWRMFRRAFLWTLAATAVAMSLRAQADEAVADEVAVKPLVVAPTAVPETVPELPALSRDVLPETLPPAPAPCPPDERRPLVTETPTAYGSVTTFGPDGWTVTIIPQQRPEVRVNGLRYEDVYASIPYRRTEYLANPGYRHESALEVMFGQLRPKTVVSHYQPHVVPSPQYTPYKPYRYSQTELNYLYYRPLGGLYGFGFPLAPSYPLYPAYPMLY